MTEENLKEQMDRISRADVAREIMAGMLGSRATELRRLKKLPDGERNDELIKKMEDERKIHLRDRLLMYKGDLATISKILDVYAPQLKKEKEIRAKAREKANGK